MKEGPLMNSMDDKYISHLSSIVFGGPMNMHAVQLLHKFHLVSHFFQKLIYQTKIKIQVGEDHDLLQNVL